MHQNDNFLPPGPTEEQINAKLDAIERGSNVLTVNDWITSSGKYPERANSPELTDEIKNKASVLMDVVNQLLAELDYNNPIKISSGFRPSSVNASVGGAKKSLHMTGSAVDLEDRDGSLDELFSSDAGQTLLEKYQLWQEHPSVTKNWEHLDLGNRKIMVRLDCKKRQFLP